MNLKLDGKTFEIKERGLSYDVIMIMDGKGGYFPVACKIASMETAYLARMLITELEKSEIGEYYIVNNNSVYVEPSR